MSLSSEISTGLPNAPIAQAKLTKKIKTFVSAMYLSRLRLCNT